MSVKIKTQEYGQGRHILAIPDHYVSIAIKIPQATQAGGIVVSQNGRLVVKAGTVYPANDATAQGLIFQDYDVTDGDVTAALLIHGFVRGDRLPAAINANAKLSQITVVPAITASSD